MPLRIDFTIQNTTINDGERHVEFVVRASTYDLTKPARLLTCAEVDELRQRILWLCNTRAAEVEDGTD